MKLAFAIDHHTGRFQGLAQLDLDMVLPSMAKRCAMK